MALRFHTWVIGAALALGLPQVLTADQMDALEETCTPPHPSFAAHVARAKAQGWQRNTSDPTVARMLANFKALSSKPVAMGFVRDGLVLVLSEARGITGCRIVDPVATSAVDAELFAKRFDVMRRSDLGPMLRMDAQFFATADAPPQPGYASLGDGRPKTDIGLTGQLMSGAYFSQ
jgi:hypothetical protein